MELGPEQLAAIITPGNLVVRAGAGAGKTEVLARRFVALASGALDGAATISPMRIVAITFTERAALDMRQRIEQVVDSQLAAETAEERRQTLRSIRRTLPLARISTIHAFCARLLRENAFEAGVEPSFRVLDEYESDTLLEEICREGIIDALRQGDPAARRLVRARRLDASGPREDARAIIQRLYKEAQRLGLDCEQVAQLTIEAVRRIAADAGNIQRQAGELAARVDQLLQHQSKATESQKKRLQELEPRWPAYRRQIVELNAESDARDFEVLRELCGVLPGAQGGVKNWVKAVRELVVDDDSTAFGLKGDLITAWGEQRGAAPARELAELFRRIGLAVERGKSEKAVLTFDDLLLRTRELLRRHPAAARRCRNEISALLIDEYQDVDPIQDEIVNLLSMPEAGDAAAQVFIVGDEKQSIYRFRGADVRIFNQPRSSATIYLPLRANRRSTPNILNFVNALGAIAMHAEDGPPLPPFRVRWQAEHELSATRSPQDDAAVEILIGLADTKADESREASLKAADARRLEARALANRIRETLAAGEIVQDKRDGEWRPARLGDIAILFRALTDISIYERGLTSAGIDCYTVRGRGFYQQREVIDLIELLAAVADPDDSIALAAALRSPLFCISDDCLLEIGLQLNQRGLGVRSPAQLFAASDFSWLTTERDAVERAAAVIRRLREARGRVSLPHLLEIALDLTDYEGVVALGPRGAQRSANLRKLVELARHFDAHRRFTFHEFTAYLRQLTTQEPLEAQAQTLGEHDDVVRLMTVHQAKGLEFPVVILADAGRAPNHSAVTPLLDPTQGLLVNATAGSGDDEIPNAAVTRRRAQIKEEEQAESARLLYVAVTRARDRLIVSEGATRQGWSAALRALVGVDTWRNFAESGSMQYELERAGALLRLRRPDFSQPAPWASASADRKLDEAQLELVRRRLNHTHPGRMAVDVTATGLADFERCPRQYWLRHELGLPENRPQFASNGGAIALGSVAHAVLEEIGFEQPSTLAAEVQKLCGAIGLQSGLAPADRLAVARDLTSFLSTRSSEESIITRELPFVLNPTPWLVIRGQIDALVEGGDKAIVVRDYKYAEHADAERYHVQLEAYVLAASHVFPGRRIAAELIALREGPEIVRLELPELEAIRADLIAIGARLQDAYRDADFAKKPASPNACRRIGCTFVARCWDH